ncbi:MAG: carboxypeptidase M32 [bacterium]|nr:carboxypeptidase M32 [bacterium]
MRKQNSKPRNEIEKLSERLRELSYLGSAIAVLHWDQEVNMPRKGGDARAKSIALLAGLLHNKFLNIDHDGLLSGLKKKLDDKKLVPSEAAIVRETVRSFEKARKLPETFVKEMAELTSKAQNIWAEARAENKFELFAPYLEGIVEKKREEAKLLGYEKSPYDALLDEYEPGATVDELERIFTDLKSFLVPFIKRIADSKQKPKPFKFKGTFLLEQQIAFNRVVAESMGYDLEAGRIDVSTHPFTTGFHPHDVRFTTRYNPKNIFESIFPTLHEGGHALYEQGLSHEHFGTPLADSVSLGIHESQSRMWENMVGKSLPFWKHWYPKLRKAFPKAVPSLPLAEVYRSINIVKPTLVRVEADEVTYNMHIIIRFELEKALVEGTLEVRDLPKLWNERYKQYLGVTPKTDREGVLQDVHWSAGLMGYFPTYTLGNLYSAQFWNIAKQKIPDLEKKMAAGDFKTLRQWLKAHIHEHGKFYSAADLALHLTGETLNPDHFCAYLKNKYEEIYGLK